LKSVSEPVWARTWLTKSSHLCFTEFD